MVVREVALIDHDFVQRQLHEMDGCRIQGVRRAAIRITEQERPGHVLLEGEVLKVFAGISFAPML